MARRLLQALCHRRLLLAVAGGVALVLLASPSAVGDAISNVAPASQVSGISTEFPLGNYALDSHFSAVSVGLFSGVDVSGVPPMIAYFLANTLWQLTAFLANALITLFTFAFSLDLVNGSQATGGAGALAPVSGAVHTIYSTVFGAPWLTVAVVLAGMWAMWRALVQRRYVETFGALALSLVYVVIALAFVTEPQATIGSASRWTNEMSSAFLSLTSQGNLSSQQQAKRADSDQLFDVLIYQPWVVLQFGGVEHCVTTGTSNSASVQPLSAQESQALANGTEIQAGDRTCINNANKYASHFLRYSPDDNDRTDEYTALEKGDSGDLPNSDPSKASGSYKLGPADEPAADAMGKGGQYQRLLLSIVIFAGECGAFLLLGALSVAVILSQVILLLLLAFAPVALVVAVFPGRGHAFFLGWLTRLATFLLRKAVYSLVLAVLLAVAAALDSASADLGWLMSFGLEATFFWATYLYRHQLTSHLSLATTGHGGTEDQALRFATLYAFTRNLGRRALRTLPTPPSGGGGSSNGPGPRGGSNPPSSSPPQPSGDTSDSPDTLAREPEPVSPESTLAEPAVRGPVSATRGDTPRETVAEESSHDQPSTSTVAEPVLEPAETREHASRPQADAKGEAPVDPRPNEPPAPRSGPGTPRQEERVATPAAPTHEESSDVKTPSPPPASASTNDVAPLTSPPPSTSETSPRRVEPDQPVSSPPTAATTQETKSRQASAEGSLAESVRRDLRRIAPSVGHALDAEHASAATQTSPTPPAPLPARPNRPADSQSDPSVPPMRDAAGGSEEEKSR